jgi:hypothetical protein
MDIPTIIGDGAERMMTYTKGNGHKRIYYEYELSIHFLG